MRRFELSKEACKTRRDNLPHTGVIIGETLDKKGYRIIFDGTKTPQTYHKSFIVISQNKADADIQKTAHKGSCPLLSITDIDRMRIYQQNLIDFLLYEQSACPKAGINNLETAKIHQEIKDVEIWLKSMTNDFILNNSREFQS